MLLLASALLTASLGNFPLQNGNNITECKVTYRTYGTLNSTKSNVILFPTWFNGTTADLEKYIGPQGLADDSKFFIVTVDALSNGVSSSPSNSGPSQKGRLFPRITIRDMVETQYQLLTTTLGIRHVYAVMGISMGGMQTFQWLAAYPDFMDRAVTIVGTPKMGQKDILLWTSFMAKVNLGRKPDVATLPAEGDSAAAPAPKPSVLGQLLSLAAPVLQGLLDQQANQQLGQVVEGGNQPGNTPAPSEGKPGTGQAQKTPVAIPLNKNPEDVLHQFEAMIVHDISRPFSNSLDSAGKEIRAKVLVINATQDRAVSPELPQSFADIIHAEKFMLTGPCGHNAYKSDCELNTLAPVVQKFLTEDPSQ